MMWTLRNKHKIKAHFEPWGDEILARIENSLDETFTADNEKLDIEKVDGEPYPILTVNDTGHSFGIIMFYVVKEMYGVYLLAFKEFVS